MPVTATPNVTVIVPVFNDRQRLEICLRALEAQIYPATCMEVIVVDNGSTDRAEEVVGRFPRARFALETSKGSYAARNRGVALAGGEVLAFTDSDCIPDRHWIERGVASLMSHVNCGMIAGRVDVFFHDPRRPTAVELHESVRAFRQRDYLRRKRFGVTANIMTFKRVFDAVGTFDARLESGGDMEWGQRVAASGFVQVYADDARIRHPARRSLAEMRRKVVRVTQGQLALSRIEQTGPRSAMRNCRALAGSVLGDLCVPLADIYADRRLRGSDQKAKVALVELFRGYWTARTRLTLAFGGNT